jgi:coiled-coil domain-containing protein 12
MSSKVKFRNYRQKKDEPVIDQSTPSANIQDLIIPKGIEKEAIEIEQEIETEKPQEPIDDDAVELIDLAPKKPNWDLKRDLEEKYVDLEAATTAAIRELISKIPLILYIASRLTAQHDISKIKDV